MVSVPFHIEEKLALRDLSARELRTELMYLSTEKYWGLVQRTSIPKGGGGIKSVVSKGLIFVLQEFLMPKMSLLFPQFGGFPR